MTHYAYYVQLVRTNFTANLKMLTVRNIVSYLLSPDRWKPKSLYQLFETYFLFIVELSL